MFSSVPFWIGAIYITIPMGLLIYGWNDLGDVETDAVNPRKGNWLFGAKPKPKILRRLPLAIVLVQLPFLAAFIYIAGIKMAIWFLALLIANATYNSLGFKQLPFLDLANQVGYLLIFVLASWLCDVEQLNAPAMVFSGLFAMQSHLFGQIMDVDQDKFAGRKSTAVTIGIVPSKLLLSCFMLLESLIAFYFFRGPYVGLFMLAGALFFFADAFLGPKHYPTKFLIGFFVGWNIVCLSTMHYIWNHGLFLLS